VLPKLIESLIMISYGGTLIILSLRTLSLFGSSSRLDRTVQLSASIGLLVALCWITFHLVEVRGDRFPGTTTK